MTTLSQAAPWRQLSQWFHDEILEPLFVVLTLIGIVVGIWLEGAGAPDSLTLLVHLATYFFWRILRSTGNYRGVTSLVN